MSTKTRQIAPAGNKRGETKAEAKNTNVRKSIPKEGKEAPQLEEGAVLDEAQELPVLPPHIMNKIIAQNERVQELSQRSFELFNQQLTLEEQQKQFERGKKDYEGDFRTHLKGVDKLNQDIVRTCGGTIEILDDEGHYRVVEQIQQR